MKRAVERERAKNELESSGSSFPLEGAFQICLYVRVKNKLKTESDVCLQVNIFAMSGSLGK